MAILASIYVPMVNAQKYSEDEDGLIITEVELDGTVTEIRVPQSWRGKYFGGS
jgi:hypothetical protein